MARRVIYWHGEADRTALGRSVSAVVLQSLGINGGGAIPAETYYPLYSLGARFRQVFRYILVPATLPNFITAIRVAMATAVSVLFFTETFGTQYGMGYFIMDAWLRVNYLEMYTGIVILSLIGLLLFGLLDLMEGRLCRWQMK